MNNGTYFKQFQKGGYPAMIDLRKVDGWWPDNQSGTIILIHGQEIWLATLYEDFSKEMEIFLTDDF